MVCKHQEVINSGHQTLEISESWSKRWGMNFDLEPLQKSRIWLADIKQLNNERNTFLLIETH